MALVHKLVQGLALDHLNRKKLHEGLVLPFTRGDIHEFRGQVHRLHTLVHNLCQKYDMCHALNEAPGNVLCILVQVHMPALA